MYRTVGRSALTAVVMLPDLTEKLDIVNRNFVHSLILFLKMYSFSFLQAPAKVQTASPKTAVRISCFKMISYPQRAVISFSTSCKFQLFVFFVTFFIVLPFYARDMVFSIYKSSILTSDILHNKILLDGEAAFKKTERYLATIKDSECKKFSNWTKMVITIITVRRFSGFKPLGYLTRVVAAFHSLIDKDTANLNKFLFICNTHAGPGHHEEAYKLKKYFYLVSKFPNGSAEASIMNPFEKEKQDYVFCMEQALKFSSEYILMVEDDALPRDELFPVLENSINYLQDINKKKQWSHLKLYFPERWQGYSFELKQICELLALFVIGSMGLHVFMSNVSIRYKRISNNWRTSFLGGIYLVLVALTIGRQHLLEIKRIWPYWYGLVSAPECCSPCILYQNKSAIQIVQHLKTVKCDNHLPLDIALHRSTQAHSNVYQIEPNLFSHIGLVSTIKGLSQYPEEFVL